MLTWTRKRAFASWRTGISVLFSGIYPYFPEKYTHNSGFKMYKVQKGGAITLMWRKTTQKAEISQMSMYYIYIYMHISVLSRYYWSTQENMIGEHHRAPTFVTLDDCEHKRHSPCHGWHVAMQPQNFEQDSLFTLFTLLQLGTSRNHG